MYTRGLIRRGSIVVALTVASFAPSEAGGQAPAAAPAPEAPPASAAPAAEAIAFSCPARGAFVVDDSSRYFSQFYEDYILSYVFQDVATGAYVDVGAYDPDKGSVTKYFYRKGWRGVNVEPNPEHLASLQRVRTEDTNVGVGISDEAATLTFYKFEARASGLSTFDPDTAARHKKAGFTYEELTIPVATLTDVLDKSGKVKAGFEILNVDVEGFEKKVLTGLDFKKYPPTVVIIESTAPLTEDPTHQNWESILFANGYVFATDDGLNRYYLHGAHRDRLTRFLEVGYCVGKDKASKRIKLDGFQEEATR